MPPLNDVRMHIRVIDDHGQYLGGTVDLEVVHRRRRHRTLFRRVDASKEIRISLKRWPAPGYDVTITPAGTIGRQSRFIRVPKNGAASLEFVFPGPRLMPRLTRQEVSLFAVSGRVSGTPGTSVAGLRVLIVDRNVERDIPLAQAITDERGRYAVQFEASRQTLQKPQLDLQARAYLTETFLGASEVRYNAAANEVLDVVLTAAAPRQAEHEAVSAAIGRYFGGRPGSLQETDDRTDITYLANKTGWDARAVALAALADQFSEIRDRGRAADGIAAPFYYALFRSGLPANDTLFQVSSGTIERAWKSAIDGGVIDKSLVEEIPRAKAAFEALSATTLLTSVAPAGLSPMTEMLAVAGFAQDQQQQFASLYAANRTDLPAFWTSVKENFGEASATRLQVVGKIGFLTLNNAPLMSRLQAMGGDNGLSDPVQLADAGLHRAGKWDELLTADVPIPDRIPGENGEAKRANYAAYLAAQVRLSYPTAAVADMVRAGDVKLGAAAEVHAFLASNHGEFEIGVQPVEQYIARKQLDVPQDTVREIKRLQRVYQITPGDQAMSVLLDRGVDSAYHIVRFDRDAFVRTFSADLGGDDQARHVYHRATQVHNAVLNLTLSYLTAKNGVAIGTPTPAGSDNGDRRLRPGSSGAIVNPRPRRRADEAGDVIAYPTLEGLFGELDFCACDECRSILSPSAYLVDLLNFVDKAAPVDGMENPQTVLFERRPDLQHLPLSCENTNTALPYIDIVNETLEYFIANEAKQFSLTDYVGHDTGRAASADLLAMPQFVMDDAYKTLLSHRFPAPLPFHKPLEELRRYFDKFEVPLTLAMERLRVSDALERGANPYGWRDILFEELLLSRAEYGLLTKSTAIPLARMFGFPESMAEVDVIAALSNAKQFTRRLDITYIELVKILTTRFVNPNANLIPKAEKLGVSFGVLAALKNDAITPEAFDALLPTGAGAPDPAAYDGDIKGWVTDDENFARLMGLIVLTDPTGNPDPCQFEHLELRHAQPMTDATDTSTRLSAAELVRILRLIRVWKKTQWTIEQADVAICALFDGNLSGDLEVDTLEQLDAGFALMLPRLGVVMRVMRTLNLTVARDLSSVLALWAPISTYGANALYRQMFLNPAVLRQDPVFDDNGFGEFLQDPAQKLLAHAEALRSALTLTADEFDRIVAAQGFDATTPLNVKAVSAVFRRGWLARKLSISVRELLLLVKHTGLRPFAVPDLTDPAILRLAALVAKLKSAGLKSTTALYLLWNQDITEKAAPDPAQITELARTLRADFAAIDDQFAVTDDPTGDIARARMALVYGTDTTDAFFALIDDTVPLDVPYTNPQPKLKPAITAADPRISYDNFRHRLSTTGVFTVQRRNALRNVAGVPPAFKTAVEALFDRSQDVVGSFFGRYPELKPLYDAYVASPAPPEKKRRQLLASFRPELSRRRREQQTLQRLSAAVAVDLTFTQTLINPPAEPYPLHAAGHPHRPLLADILGLQRAGLRARFFFRATATGAVNFDDPAAGNLNYSADGGNPLPEPPQAGHPISGIWRGLLEAPETGFFNLIVEADVTSDISIRLGGEAKALTQHGAIWRNTDPIELTAGTLYEITITAEKIRETLAVKWETPVRTRDVIPGRYLYSHDAIDTFFDAYVRFVKSASLAIALGLTSNEIAFLGTHADYAIAGDGWLNALSVRGVPDQATGAALVKPLEALLDFARIKREVAPDDESLLTLLRHPVANANDADGLLFTLMRWDQSSLKDLVAHFQSQVADLKSVEFLRRVYDAFTLIRTMGIAGSAMIAATTNNPTAEVVRDLQGALRARYDLDDWREVVQPINDAMRGLQRNALVAFILHRLRSRPATAHIDTPDKLFEYFLMDVQMEPCMQTSRIRHALSSVQLFIERCLMNLEPRVSPASLSAAHWEWMKRYRVWEANRKVFLFPENWLEPELRDDKSPFFKDLEGELLQGEITEDAAAIAILNYLSKLESVAKLHPVGIHHVAANPDQQTGAIDHVIAATPGSRRKYYYRRREYGYWTPWEQIKLDIEDNPIVPVVWDGRLLLFWLQLMKQTPESAGRPQAGKDLVALKTDDVPADPAVKVQAVLGWSEYFNGKWQPPKTSDVTLPTELRGSSLGFLRKNLALATSEQNDWLRVSIYEGLSELTSFVLYNTHSAPVRREEQTSVEKTPGPFVDFRLVVPLDTSEAAMLGALYLTPSPLAQVPAIQYRSILLPDTPVGVASPHHPSPDIFASPFLMHDRRHAFYVSSAQESKWVPDYFDFGIVYDPGPKVQEIPPFVIAPEEIPAKPKFWGDGGPIGPDPGIVDPIAIHTFVTQDAYISQGLATSAAVTYGDKQIGPGGAFAGQIGVQRRRNDNGGGR